VPRTDEVGAFFEREIAARDDFKRVAFSLQEEMSAGLYNAASRRSLSELDSVRARALLARLDFEADALPARQRIKVHT
jgi:hypothetical protein